MIQMKFVAVSFAIIFFLAGCASPAFEKLRLPGDLPGWKLGHKQRDRLTNSMIWEHIPENEYISKWTKMYTVQFYDKKRVNPEAFMLKLKSEKARVCKNIRSKVLDKQADSILYEWQIKDCKRYKDQHELGRIISGKEGLHRVAYTEKILQIPLETYKQWKKKLLGAYLETGDQ